MTLDAGGAPLGARAQLRAKRRRQRRLLAVLVAGLTLAALAVVTVLLVSGGGSGTSKKQGPVRTQRTLLLQVKGSDGAAVASALLATDPSSGTGVVVLVPQQVLVNVPGGGNVAFGAASRTAKPAAVRGALSDLMGVTIDGSWLLDAPTFSQLIDQIGGVQATVDVQVVSGRTVLLQPGAQRLSGAGALQYATFLAPGEQEQTRLTRLQAVLEGLLTSLPANPDTVIKALGGGSQPSQPASTVADMLTGLRTDDQASNLQYRTLPVIPITDGSEAIRFRVDAPATRSLVDDVLAQSIPPGSRTEGNRVLVLNGVGTPGLGQQVRDKLVPAGFVFVGSRNAPSFGYATTQVLIPNGTAAEAAIGERVARALGVPLSAVQSSNQIGTIADVVVIVGKDFKAK